MVQRERLIVRSKGALGNVGITIAGASTKINHFNASLSFGRLPRVKTSPLIKLELGSRLTDCVRIFQSVFEPKDEFLQLP